MNLKIGDKVRQLNYNPNEGFPDCPNKLLPEFTNGVIVDIEEYKGETVYWVKQEKMVIGFYKTDLELIK